MTIIKLVDGTTVNASSVELVSGILKITTTDLTVEELAAKFKDKSNTSLIKMLTASGIETGFKTGFTSFAGIEYDEEGNKTIEMFQPIDATELRISNAEGAANVANAAAEIATTTAQAASDKTLELEVQNAMLEAQNVELAMTMDSILVDIIPSLQA